MALIAYLDRFSSDIAFDLLRAHPDLDTVQVRSADSPEQSFAALADAHAYQCVGARDEVPEHLRVTEAFLARTPNLLVASSSGSGVDVFDIAACTRAGVLVVNQAGANANAVAETVLTMMMALRKNLSYADRALRTGWTGTRQALYGHDLQGRTIGIFGLGNIGRRVAEICTLAFGCQVLAVDPYLDAETVAEKGARKVALPEMLAQADVITVHTPLNAETRYAFGAAEFAAMKRGAIFLNTARGFIHDEPALAAALASGHLGGAGIDVWEQEPPSPDHPLLQLDTVMASPHIAGCTHTSTARMTEYAIAQLADVFAGKPPSRPINPEVLPRFAERLRALGIPSA